MIRLWFLLLCALSLHAVTLTKQTLYEKSDHIDLMLSFDAPYKGQITRTHKPSGIVLTLEGVAFPSQKAVRKVRSQIVDTITIAAVGNKTVIGVDAPHKLRLEASKTIDNSGLRIRIYKAKPAAASQESPMPIPSPQTAPVSAPESFSFAFVKIMLVLGALIALLWFLKRWLERKSGGGWLFGKTDEKSDIQVVMQKPIDMKNRVVLLRYGKREYLLLLGENNLILDRFGEVSQEEDGAFEKVLQERGKRLSDYLEQ